MPTLRFENLSDFHDASYRVYANCQICSHYRLLDIPTLISACGDIPLHRIRNRLKCRECGSSGVQLTISADAYRKPASEDKTDIVDEIPTRLEKL